MKDDVLEVRLNQNENFQFEDGYHGQITHLIKGDEKDVYLGSDFKTLISYVLKSAGDLNAEQQNTASAIKEKIANESSTNKVIITLYDDDNKALEGQYAPGEIYLNDTVEERVYGERDLINMGVSTRPSVG